MSDSIRDHGLLAAEFKRFLSQWDDTRLLWKDQVASDFEKIFIAETRSEMASFLTALEDLNEELCAARRTLEK
jgi:hypothetical protein